MSGRAEIVKPVLAAAVHALGEKPPGDIAKAGAAVARRLLGSGEAEAAAANEALATQSLERLVRPTQVKVAPPAEADYEGWHGLFNQYGGVSRDVSQSVWADIRSSDPKVNALLAKTNDGQTVGFLHFYEVPHLQSGSIHGYAENFYVEPSARKLGAPGLKLMSKLLEEGDSRGWTAMHWITDESNVRARTIYDHIVKPSKLQMYSIKEDVWNRSLSVTGEHASDSSVARIKLSTEPLQVADRPAWEQMFQQHITESRGTSASKTTLETSWNWLQDRHNNLTGLIARTDTGEPIGFAHLRGFPRPLYAMNGGKLDDLFVSEAFRGQGAGTELALAAVRETKMRGWLSLRWDVANSDTASVAFSDKIAFPLPRAIYETSLTENRKLANRFLIGK